MKRILASAALTATVLTGGLVIGSGSAFAQDDAPDDTAPTQDDSTTETPEQDGEGCNRFTGLAETLGLDAEELRDSLRSGQSLADIAEAEGISVDDVVDALLEQRTERIEAGVESGRITEEEAAERLADAEERITDRVNGEGDVEGRRGPGRRGHRGPGHDGATDDAPADASFTPTNAVADGAVSA